MNEHHLGRLLRRLILLSAPLPLGLLGAACGGSTSINDPDGNGGMTTQGGTDAAGTGSGGSHAGAGGVIGLAGAGGDANACRGTYASVACSPNQSTVPRSCITPNEALVGTVLPAAECKVICLENGVSCSVSALTDSTVSVLCQTNCVVGRRPVGLGESGTCDARAAGDYFAEIAHLEAAAVTAFHILRDELRLHGAPKKLVRAAARAARDEARHARATGALARRFGGRPRLPSITPTAPRSLEAMALENAIEGCVRETYGALLATRQAKLATDPVVRAAMTRIARDETRHASLSWQVGRWLETRLDPGAKRNVARAQKAAAHEFIGELASEPHLPFAGLAGLPSPAEAARLATELQRALWS